jgi:hypothetical protein
LIIYNSFKDEGTGNREQGTGKKSRKQEPQRVNQLPITNYQLFRQKKF